ncbi:MAG: hypothetical protein ACI8RD_005076 [Bacillariaceae sp.]|jgi:hypothetical protein
MAMFNITSSIFLIIISFYWLDHVKGFTVSGISRSSLCQIRPTTTYLHEKPSWLDDAMEGIDKPSGKDDVNNNKNEIQNLQPGIAGFAVDPDLGCVSILVGKNCNDDQNDDDDNNNDNEQQLGQYWVPVVVSPVDKDRIKSPEALTCVQLAGGLDLGTAILPPDSLAKLVIDHKIDEHDGSDEAIERYTVSSLRSRISLSKVTMIPNPDSNDENNDFSMKKKKKNNNIDEEEQDVPTTPEREQSIQDTFPKVEKAVKSLPGLEESTTDSILKAIQRFSDLKGIVDRKAFSSILDALRISNTPSLTFPSPIFQLEVSIIDEDGISQVIINTTNAMVGLGLAMRYKVIVQVEEKDNHKQGENGVDALLETFPAFRPIQELNEDSKIMDGFIPSMYGKARLDNDMKE